MKLMASIYVFFPHTNSPDLYRASGKFEVLDRMLPKFKASGHRLC